MACNTKATSLSFDRTRFEHNINMETGSDFAPVSAKLTWWFFTWNNPPDLDTKDHEVFWGKHPLYTGVTYQKEKGKEGTEHWQGVLHLKAPGATMGSLKKWYGDEPHWERVKSLPKALAYVRKEDSRVAGPWTIGDVPEGGQGTRSDIVSFVESVKGGKRDAALIDEHPEAFVKYFKAAGAIRLAVMPSRDYMTELHILYGPPGTGKSWSVDIITGGKAFYKPDKGEWWDGYMGDNDVVLDDFYGAMAYSDMLKVVDRYKHIVQVKGGYAPFIAKRVFITSNSHPINWWPNIADKRAFFRRITTLTEVTMAKKGLGEAEEEYALPFESIDDLFPYAWDGKEGQVFNPPETK